MPSLKQIFKNYASDTSNNGTFLPNKIKFNANERKGKNILKIIIPMKPSKFQRIAVKVTLSMKKWP